MPCIVKKTVKTIIDSGHDYVIQVKGNQPTLWRTLMEAAATQPPLSRHVQIERSRGRHEQRMTTVFQPPAAVMHEWNGLYRFIHVEHRMVRGGQATCANHYYISSVHSDQAECFATGIRGHWSIENRLHWVKDVIQHEDAAGIKAGNGIETLSILKNVAITLCRGLGFDSIKGAAIHFASNIKELLDYFRT